MNRTVKIILNIAFWLYVILMLWLLFGQRIGRDLSGTYREMLESNINIIPFRTIRGFMNMASGTDYGYAFRYAVINLAGNVIMFVPLGFFIPFVFQKYNMFRHCMLICAISIIAVELIQLLALLGSCDIDDLILNMTGAAIGYGMYVPISRKLIK